MWLSQDRFGNSIIPIRRMWEEALVKAEEITKEKRQIGAKINDNVRCTAAEIVLSECSGDTLLANVPGLPADVPLKNWWTESDETGLHLMGEVETDGVPKNVSLDDAEVYAQKSDGSKYMIFDYRKTPE